MLARRVVGRRNKSGTGSKFLAICVAVAMVGIVFGSLPRTEAAMVLVDEANIGDLANEAGRLDGWGPALQGTSGYGNFDPQDPWGSSSTAGHNLRCTWMGGADEPSATVTFAPNADAKLIQLRVLNGQGDDSFVVSINDKVVFSYTWENLGSEQWITHDVPVKAGAGALVVKITATGQPWGGIETWGQLAVNWIRVYGMSGFDMFGYNYGARIFVGTYDSSDRYIDGLYWGASGDYVDDAIVMKWSVGWDEARFHEGVWGPDAYETNHVVGDYIGDDGQSHQYTYFVKIMWVGPGGDLWNEFTIVQEVYNDVYGGYHGLQYKAEPGPGFG